MSDFEWSDAELSVDGGEEYTPIQDVTLEMSDNIKGGEIVTPDELEVSLECEIEVDTESVVCPHCNLTNQLPEESWLLPLSREPHPCQWCGYPLR